MNDLFTVEVITAKEPLYVDVALGVPQDEPYQYVVPAKLNAQVALGKRVLVPLRNQTRYGYIVGISKTAQINELKPITEVVDPEPYVDDKLLALTRWMAEYYFCSWGQALEAAMPAPFKKGKTTIKTRKPKGDAEVKEWVHATPNTHVLTEDQARAFYAASEYMERGVHADFLLHGVTGSGKTEIYLCLIEKLLKEKRGAIVLVPEISLTPQTVDRFESRFEKEIAVIHSRLSQGKRLEAWHRIRRGEARIVVGARSAVFSPVQSLGLIVIDEEHDDSYKQGETPRYDAALVAKKRCEIENAVLIRGTATPRLESYYATETGTLLRLDLPKRIADRPLPEVCIVDMKDRARGSFGRVFSFPLEEAIRDALKKGEQAILFLNRRGFAPYVNCPSCGYVASCPKCGVSLVFHSGRQDLICHTCSYTTKPPRLCPGCHKGYLRYLGVGTEKVEEEALKVFPTARVARMDTDSTTRSGIHEKILRSFRKKEIQILLGTQMIAKGHDFPGVSVIGVISADTALHLPDFRSAERSFDLLTQVAGRAGRENVRGRVFIQTYLPDHYTVRAAKNHDYKSFYEQEIRFREDLHLPPFTHLLKLTFSGRLETLVAKKAMEFKRLTEKSLKDRGMELLGPSPALIPKRGGSYFWSIFYKGGDVLAMNLFLRAELKEFDKRGIRYIVDVDPR